MFTCLIHDITLTNSYKIVDYTHIPQSEIDKVFCKNKIRP